jgi:hypothetical protein
LSTTARRSRIAKVDTDLVQALVPVAVAAIGGIVAYGRKASEIDRARTDIGKLLDQYERLDKLPAFEADARSLEEAIHSYVEILKHLEATAAERAWQRALALASVVGAGVAGSAAYLMWIQDGWWWTVGSIALAALAVTYLVSAFLPHKPAEPVAPPADGTSGTRAQ